MSWLSRIRNVFRSAALDREIEDEHRLHVEERAAALGIPPEEARARFGNSLRLREESRDARVALWLDILVRDLQVALRVWRRRPTLAATAILTIALGAGLNSAIVETLWAAVLKPLPYPDPGRLAQIWIDDGKEARGAPGAALVEQWREANHVLTHLAGFRGWRVTLATAAEPQQVAAALVSPEYFDALGARFVLGRPFTPAEARPGAAHSIVLTEDFWRGRFGSNPAVIGREVAVDGTLCRVAGVVSRTFSAAAIGATAAPEVYLPLARAQVAGMRVPMRSIFAIARLRDGVSLEAARAALAAIAQPQPRGRIWLSPLQAEAGRSVRPALLALFLATACLLLIACANLATLLMSHAVVRRRELAIRGALGAGASRLVRQLLTEASVLLLAGCGVGLALSAALTRLLTALYPGGLPRAAEAGPSWAVRAATLGAIFAVGLIFASLPAWRASRDSAEASLRAAGSIWMTRSSRRWTHLLVAAQAALATLVLGAAGLLLQSFHRLASVDLGLDREHVVTAAVDLPAALYPTRDDRARFGSQWVERLSALPGVSAAAISNSLPLRYTTLLDVLIHIPGQDGERMVAARAVSSQYFEAMGLRFVAGAPFDERQPGQVVVNQAFVRRYLPGRPAVGVALGTSSRPSLIAGVVADVRHTGLRDAARPEIYLPFSSFPLNPVETAVRSRLPRRDIEAALRRELQALDSRLAVARFLTMDEVVGQQLAGPRFQALLVGLFASVALLLAAVGTYGVTVQSVRARMPEFALRVALGASRRDLLRLVAGAAMRAPLAGLLAGLAAAVPFARRALDTLLYGVQPGDPLPLAATAATLAAVALLACLIPARLAGRADPARALRQD